MDIHLNSLIPHPLEENIDSGSIWRKDTTLFSNKKYLAIAPSGKGKSTLINILAGNRKDYQGNVLIENKQLKSFTLNEIAYYRQSKISVVYQDLKLFPQLSAYENIDIKQRVFKHVNKDKILYFFERMGLKGFENKPTYQMSMGQQQRLAIIRAFSQPFKWLLMDEPFSHLDDVNIEIITACIDEQLKENNAGLLLTSLGSKYQFNDYTLVQV